jgi:hypothetical protein
MFNLTCKQEKLANPIYLLIYTVMTKNMVRSLFPKAQLNGTLLMPKNLINWTGHVLTGWSKIILVNN